MAFEIHIALPCDHLHLRSAFVSKDAICKLSKASEKAGFSGVTVTDHPAPTQKWLENGGHYAQDPFVLLSMVAAVTDKLRLKTGILVLPYRNPFITARAATTLDVFSDGRLELGIGAGYMRKEYVALGVDFETRNDLMDEYILALKAAWTGEPFSFAGSGYEAAGICISPAPVQHPHPPVLIGGNSRRAIRRAVDLGDAWYPFFVPEMVTKTARTATMAGNDDLQAGIDYLKDYAAKTGKAVPPTICSGLYGMRKGWSANEAIDTIGALQEMGVAGGDAGIYADSREEWVDEALRFGEEVLARIN